MLTSKTYKQQILWLFCFGVIIIATNFITQLFFFSGQTESVALTNAIKKTKEREGVINTFLERAKNTIQGLRESTSFNRFLGEPSAKMDFEILALNIAKTHPEIMNIRFLNASGTETIRVVRNTLNSVPEIAALSELQDKSHRYYFKEALTRPTEKVWFSDLDLNMEHHSIELPYKPTIRAILPISQQRKFKGVLVVNYYMEPFLKVLFSAPLYNMILADDRGQILVHYDKSRHWSGYSNTEGLSLDTYPSGEPHLYK